MGHIFKLGAKYSTAMNCTVLDHQGKQQPVIMGCYGIGVTRMASACIEQNHDDRGILWPPHVAPYHIHLLNLTPKDVDVVARCEQVYEQLLKTGIEVLYDDRSLRPGEKFSDADLIGLPVRLAVSRRTLDQDRIEFKFRSASDSQLLTLDQTIQAVRDLLTTTSA